jgi:hypothetical protein
MIARIGEHNQLPGNLDPDYVSGIREFVATCLGFCAGYDLPGTRDGARPVGDSQAGRRRIRLGRARDDPADGPGRWPHQPPQ